MAGKEPLRILAFSFCAIAFALLSVAIYTDHWREQIQRSNFGMSGNSAKAFEGLWNNCWWDATGQTHCHPQPYSRRTINNAQGLSLPARFYAYRGLCVIGILTNFVAMLFLMTGLKCITVGTNLKTKMQIGAAMNFVAGACVLITFILFKVNEWQTGAANLSSSLGKGMYLLIGTLICQVAAIVLAVTGMESDDADYLDDEDQSFQPKPYQPGSIVNQQGGSSYI